ncbi:hypothetical protein ACW5XF_18660 [Aeromonas lusitana]|uniref:Thioredoxin n=1 Tax=Aeromonas lusitana TaxID=931529 RepID=A0A2M8HB40_9GAMM|nr:hypothetical protein [Aeromonas lusitana]PJC93773.1 hypothetical protein CUC44_07365 [Aeromonas lusitana]
MSIGFKSLITGALLVLAGAGGLWYALGGLPSGDDNPWLSGAEGYEQAQEVALQQGYPLLYVIESAKCRRCNSLDTLLWRAPEMQSSLAELVKVRLNPDASDGSGHILRRFPKVGTLPGVYIQRPGESLRPINIEVKDQQIWMPGVTYGRGFFMPLSAAGFDAVVRVTLSLEDPAIDNAPLP